MNPANGIVTNGIPCVEAGGTANAITARFNPPVIELKNGLKVSVQATAANTDTEPYFQIENFEAFPIVKGVNQKLIAGDIAGAGHWLDLQYNGILNKWVLQNPALGVNCPSGVPVGAVCYFAMQTPPPGYLKADGSVVLRATYPELFAAIGTTFGVGDGASTFNLPNLMGLFAEGGESVGEKMASQIPDHFHAWGYHTNNNNGRFLSTAGRTADYPLAPGTDGAFWNGNNGGGWSGQGTNALNLITSLSSYTGSGKVQPPALVLLPCIKAFDAIHSVAHVNTMALASEVTVKANRADNEPYLSKAWVNFDASSGIVVIKNARNVKGVVRVEKGVYDVIFDNPMNVDTLTVTASSSALLTSVNRESLTGAYYPPTEERIRIITGSGFPPEAEDAADINVIILG